ncbi:AraC family transcriptional regulator [Catenovulum sp. 2E275]|uniref:helix-turn-helix transcriptional regulator n=1 Tax=Catenovulum sp. 2E275 TaxID=2980497 RepID=UPI0021CFC05B|nr:AraC family transcriptional regulator [Catenovulum sp. 2E275]MCU4675647.1 AraC family transcriptional regulator [Catenovulum sp. 2E275]
MAKQKVYCEPFCIQKGYDFEIHHVSYESNLGYSCFMHFHEVHEIIVFEEIDGVYFYSQGQSELKNNDIVFTPCMETHDFELVDKPKSWFIIQFLPTFLTKEKLHSAAAFFQQGMHLRMPVEHFDSMMAQITWLYQAYEKDPQSEMSKTLLKLLLLWLSDHSIPVKSSQTQGINQIQGYERLLPVVEKFKQQAAIDLQLEQAAELCHLSPSYFSRLFKSIFRCNYSEYVNRHKLYSAARMLSQSKLSITDIAFELNFSTPSHFIALFKKQFGITPKKYKMQLDHRLNRS